MNPDQFIADSKKALDPKQQYLVLKEQFKKGNRDSLFLKRLIDGAEKSWDQGGRDTFVNAYLSTQKNLLTSQNIKYITEATHAVNDLGFPVLRDHPELVDSITKNGNSCKLIKSIVFDDIIVPIINKDGKASSVGGGMVIYSGETRKNINWDSVRVGIQKSYPKQSDAIMLYSQIMHYRFLNDRDSYSRIISANSDSIDPMELYGFTNDQTVLNADGNNWALAIKWMQKALSQIDVKQEPSFLRVYGVLLYKNGQIDAGIKEVEEYLKLSKYPDEDTAKTLKKMNQRKPI